MFSRDIFLKVLLFLGAAALIVLCLPRESENHFNYEVGRPWGYSLLTAPFDIPVYLDSVSAQARKDSIDSEYEPVYRRDVTLEKTSISDFATRLNTTPGIALTPGQRNAMLERVKRLFDDGIVDRETAAKIRSGAIRNVRFIHDNVAISVAASQMRSTREAYGVLDSLFRESAFRTALALTRPAEILQPNILLDTAENTRLLTDLYQKAMAPVGVVQQGERIIDKGEVVTPSLAMTLQTFERMADERSAGSVSSSYYPLAGKALFVLLILAALWLYLYVFRRKFFDSNKMLSFLLLLVVGFVFFSAVMGASFTGGLYMVPLTMLPIMTVIFLDSRTGLFTHLVATLLCAAMAMFPFEYIVMEYVAGCVAIDSIKDMSRRSQLIRTAFFVFIAYCLSYVAIEVMQNGTVEHLSPRMFGNLGINAVLVSFAYILLFIFEKMFGFTSRVTLVELSDINNPLLRKLSEECPGTFQHSMSVSNLASAAASRIGANVQLVRAGALYHDIGKTANPAFYTENQHGVNPHDALDPLQSARVVIGHVAEGLRLAEKAKLPEVIRRFIREHHGAGKAKYFYNTYCNAHPGEDVDAAPFTYPGPNPQSRETSILMMADAVEAAARSLTDHSPEAIQALVDRIVDAQVADGLHNDSLLSFRDIREIKETFAARLRTMFHSRISYPDIKKPSATTSTTTTD